MLGQFWYVDALGQQQLGHGIEGAQRAIARGDLHHQTYVYDPTFGAWRFAADVPSIAPILPPLDEGGSRSTFLPLSEVSWQSGTIGAAAGLLLIGAAWFGSMLAMKPGLSGVGVFATQVVQRAAMYGAACIIFYQFAKPQWRFRPWQYAVFVVIASVIFTL